jgi:hypothetical protein
LTTYTEAQILNETTGSQGQISQFVANATIPVMISVGTTAANFTTNNDAFTVSMTHGNGSLTILIGAQGVSGPRVILLNISNKSFLNLQSGYLQVSLDNATLSEAASLNAVLTGSGSPSYVLLGTSSGFELLVNIPHFSTHTIVIKTPASTVLVASSSQTSTSTGSSSSIPASYVASIIVVAVVLVAVFVFASQRNKKVGSLPA